MSLRILSLVLFLSYAGLSSAQIDGTFIYNGDRKARVIKPGVGQEYTEDFNFFDNLHFVQFGVYSADYNRLDIKAPKGVGPVWLIYHRDTQTRSGRGAYYIVQPYETGLEAKQAAKKYESNKMDSWYNPDLTNVEFVLIGIAGGI